MKRKIVQLIFTVLMVGASTLHGAPDLQALRTLEPAADPGTLENQIHAEVRAADAAARETIARNLAAIVLDPAATLYGRRLACRGLRTCANEKTAAALAPLLADPDLADHVRLVLEGIQSPVADLALIAALGRTDGAVRRGVIASLATRGTGEAFAPLVELVGRTDEATTIVTLRALGAVARDARDVNAIAALDPGTAEAVLVAQQEAFFTALAHLHNGGLNLDAVNIPFPKMQARTPAIADLAVRVMLRLNPAAAVPQIIAMLQTGDPDFQRRALGAFDLLADSAARSALVARAADIPAEMMPFVIGGLAARGALEAGPLARYALETGDEATQLTAVAALGTLGDAGDVARLLGLAAGSSPLAKAAREALGQMPDRAADPLLVAEFEKVDSPVRVFLPEIFATRTMRGTVPLLLATAPAADARLAGECYEAAGALGDAELGVTLWEHWLKAPAARRGATERALVALGRHHAEGIVTGQLTAKWQAGDAAVRDAIIRLIAGIGDGAALKFLVSLVTEGKPDPAAVRALTAWRTIAALPELKALLENKKLDATLRATAWHGMFTIARADMRDDRWRALPWMTTCVKLAPRLEDKLKVVAAVGEGVNEESARWLEEGKADADVGVAATAALAEVRRKLGD